MSAQPPVRITATPGQVEGLTDRVVERLRTRPERRVMIGIVGPPGAGKSTLADALQAELNERQVSSAVVGMDGFHLAAAELARLGRAERKGAIDTFDAAGYVALLRRIRAQRPGDEVIYAPRYVRGNVEEPIGGSVPVPAEVSVALTEGNYLLASTSPWSEVATIVDETWFLDTDPIRRRERLLARHVQNGKTMERALAFTDGSDARNAEFVQSTATSADLRVQWREG